MKRRFIQLIFSLIVAGCSDTQPILIQGAMDIEVDLFLKELKSIKEETFGSYTFWEGELGGKRVVVSRTEVGLVNAAASTVLGIKRYNPSLIINQGTAGGHDPELHTSDIVIAKSTFNMGAFKSPFTPEGGGVDTSRWAFMGPPSTVRFDGVPVLFNEFKSDKNGVEVALKTPYKYGKVVEGVIGTADQWNREVDRIKDLHERFGTSVEEMESSAVAQIAAVYTTPFLGIRVVSNTDLHREEFDPQSAAYCQLFVIDLVKGIEL